MNYIKLINVPFNSKHLDTYDFDSKDAQFNYFNGLAGAAPFDNISFTRPYRYVKVELDYLECEKYNYMLFRDEENGGDRIYYAFINSIEWLAVGITRLNFHLDVIQTYAFDYKLNDSFVERAHVNRWTQDGKPDFTYCNTIENINVGEDLETIEISNLKNGDLNFLVVATTQTYTSTTDNVSPNGYPYPLRIMIFPFRVLGKRTLFMNVNNTAISTYSDVSSTLLRNDICVRAFITQDLPLNYTYSQNTNTVTGDFTIETTTINSVKITYALPKDMAEKNITTFEPLNGLTNGDELKAYCFPFNYFSINVDRETVAILKPQFIAEDSVTVKMAMSLGEQIKTGYYFSPYYSTQNESKYEVGASNSLTDIPSIHSNYLNYIQQQQASEKAGLVTSIGNNLFNFLNNYVGGLNANPVVATRSGISAAQSFTNIFMDINQVNAKHQDLKNTPDSVKKPGNNVMFEILLGTHGGKLIKKTLPSNERNRLINYFNHYGYTVNNFITPNIRSRRWWNFIKTIGANITGEIPNNYLEEIQNIFNSGVRFWHVRNGQVPTIGNYTIENREYWG